MKLENTNSKRYVENKYYNRMHVYNKENNIILNSLQDQEYVFLKLGFLTWTVLKSVLYAAVYC